MTHDLFIGDRMFSSWSLRGWLMFAAFDLPVRVHMAGLYSGTLLDDLQPVAPARLVPAMRLSDGTVVGESLAMAETLAERHAEAGLWPADPRQRATARWFCAEMVSGFQDLRADCPMQLRTCWRGFRPSPAVLADLDRLAVIWAHARAVSGADTGWLFGQYSLADVFFTPVAARVVGYGLPMAASDLAYCHDLLATPQVQAWRAEAHKVSYDPMPYTQDLEQEPWPIPVTQAE